MKRALLLAALVFLFSIASAIVIVPPVVYIATISILSLAFNMIVAIFFWIAVQGIATKRFFGKPFYSIADFALGMAGKLFFAFLLTVAIAFLLKPIESQEIAFAALLVSIVFFFSIFLAKFREIRNSEKKLAAIKNAALFSIAVFALSFAAITLSTELTAISTQQKSSAVGIADILGAPFEQKSMSPVVSEGISKQKQATVEALWVVPENSSDCIITFNGKQLSFTPEKSCAKKTLLGLEKTFCPIKIIPSMISEKGAIKIQAQGSCSGTITVFVSENGLEVQ